MHPCADPCKHCCEPDDQNGWIRHISAVILKRFCAQCSICITASCILQHILICYNAGDPFVRGHIARALYDRLHVNDTNPLVLPKGFHINYPVIGHTTVGRLVQETEKSTAVTMSWFRGAPRVDVIDGTAGHLLDEHMYVCCFSWHLQQK